MAHPVHLPGLRNKPEQKSASIGDLVQWNSGGVDQFETPRRVRAVKPFEGQEWAFVEGTKTGIPVSELTVVTAASDATASPPAMAPSAPVVSPLMNKEREWLRRKEATKGTDPEQAGAAVGGTIATEGQATRAQAARQDGGKALREWITVILLGLTIIFLGLTMVGVMIAVYGPIRDQAEAAKKTAEAAIRLSEAADQSLMENQRAWIAPRLAYFLAEPVIGKPVEMWIEYRNSGREPADSVVGEFKALAIQPSEFDDGSESRSKMRAFAEQCQDSRGWSGGNVVYPTFDSPKSYLVGFKLPDDLVDNNVARGEKLIVVQYCFRYRTFGIPRHSLVCHYYRKGITARNSLDLCEFEQKAN